MARKVETDAEAIDQLWDRLSKARVSMLWVPGSDQHPQPMTHYVDEGEGVIWFITSSDTDLAAAVGTGAQGRMTLAAPKEDYQVSLEGKLEIVTDPAKLDELWSVPAAAWFEDGRDDPHVRLLRFRPREAAIWASDSNPVLVGLRLMKAGMQDGEAEPDIGVHRVVTLGQAA